MSSRQNPLDVAGVVQRHLFAGLFFDDRDRRNRLTFARYSLVLLPGAAKLEPRADRDLAQE